MRRDVFTGYGRQERKLDAGQPLALQYPILIKAAASLRRVSAGNESHQRGEASHERHIRKRDHLSPPQCDGALQPALPLLHARGRRVQKGARRHAHRGRDRHGGRNGGGARREQAAHHGRRAAGKEKHRLDLLPDGGRPRHPRGVHHDERHAPAGAGKASSRCGRRAAEYQPRHPRRGQVPLYHAPRLAGRRPARHRVGDGRRL